MRNYSNDEIMKKSPTLNIKSGTSFIDIEDYYNLLDNSDTPVNLKLPIKLAYGGAFGIGSALIQLIGSWARTSKSSSLTSYPSHLGNEIFEQMLEKPHGLIAAYMSPEIIGDEGKRIDKNNLLRSAENHVELMHTGKLNETLKGPGFSWRVLLGQKKNFYYRFIGTLTPVGARQFGFFTSNREHFISMRS